MVVRIYPKWYEKAEKDLDATIYKIARKNDIPINFVQDSKSISDARDTILNSLAVIDGSVDVEERKRKGRLAKAFDDTIRKKNSRYNRRENEINRHIHHNKS